MTGWWSDVLSSVWMVAEVGAKKFRGRRGEQNMVKAATACPVRGGVSGEGPLGRVKVPKGIDEARRVARDLSAKPRPFVVRLEVRSV